MSYEQRQRLDKKYARKQEQQQLRRDFKGTPEDQRYVRKFWRIVLGSFLAIGGLIYVLPIWVFGVALLSLVVLVSIIAIVVGVNQGHGD